MLLGYARVSTQEQSLDRQLDLLRDAGAEPGNIHTEKISGTKAQRPALERVKMIARPGDTVIVESLTRLGRSTKDLLELFEHFDARGIHVHSLKENIDTATPTGKLLLTVLSAISEFERNITVQRVNEGLQAARARGRNGGRPKADSKRVQQALTLYDSRKYSVSEIVKLSGVSQATIYRALNQRSSGLK
jgi:DNA invertase Pin-like site-specific DNA recombinase